jgi:type III pantothenate kinase
LTDYLHERTALLPRVRLRPVRGIIGKSTEQAMLIGVVQGYRGLVGALIARLRRELGPRTPVIATGGYASLIARGVPGFAAVRPGLTLEGLRLVWRASPQPTPRGALRSRARPASGLMPPRAALMLPGP